MCIRMKKSLDGIKVFNKLLISRLVWLLRLHHYKYILITIYDQTHKGGGEYNIIYDLI